MLASRLILASKTAKFVSARRQIALAVRHVFLVGCFLAISSTARAEGHQHPGAVTSLDEYRNTYNALSLGKQPWLDAYYKLLDDSAARVSEVLGENGAVPAVFDVPGYYKDNNGDGKTDDADKALHTAKKNLLMDDARAAYTLALGWLFTGDATYRDKATSLITGWTGTRTGTSFDTDLVMTYGAAGFLLAADVLLAGGEWTEFPRFRDWAARVYRPAAERSGAVIGTVPDGQNHQTWAIYGMLLYSHVFHEDGLFNSYTDLLLDHIELTIADDGHMPGEVVRGNNGIYYTGFALEPMTAAVKVVNNVTGSNLFSTDQLWGQKMHKALQFLFYYNEHPQDWTYFTDGAGVRQVPGTTSAHGLFEAMGDVYNNQDFTEYAAAKRPTFDSDFGWTFATLGASIYVPIPEAYRWSMHNFDEGFNLFQPRNGNWAITSDSGNNVYRQSSVDTSAATATAGDPEWLDYDLRGKVKVTRFNSSGLAGVGLFARYNDASNNISFHYYKSTNQLRIERRVNGAFKVLASVTFNFALNRWYDLRVVTQGPYLRFYVDGTLRLSAKDFSFLGGKVGLYAHRSDVLFDDVRMFF